VDFETDMVLQTKGLVTASLVDAVTLKSTIVLAVLPQIGEPGESFERVICQGRGTESMRMYPLPKPPELVW